jgi:hypothetical protein
MRKRITQSLNNLIQGEVIQIKKTNLRILALSNLILCVRQSVCPYKGQDLPTVVLVRPRAASRYDCRYSARTMQYVPGTGAGVAWSAQFPWDHAAVCPHSRANLCCSSVKR